jgi:hypothetical protein
VGYSTAFTGVFKLDKPLKPEHQQYLEAFYEKRHVKWDVTKIQNIPDPLRKAVGLPVGEEGAYFVADYVTYIRENRLPFDLIVDSNHPPKGIPGLNCQWRPSVDGKCIEWDNVEKFHWYVDWLDVIIVDFLEVWGYVLNGTVNWQGDEKEDFGTIVVTDNQLEVLDGVIKPPTLPD